MPILFIEGLPGSGKTTFAKRISDYLKEQGKTVLMFQEGDLHPIDLAWCSYMDKSTFKTLLQKYDHLKEPILAHTKELGDKMITAYTRVHVTKEDVSLYRDFEQYEVYRLGDIKQFQQIHIDLYTRFSQDHDPDTFYVFECILLQNHINELILKYNFSLPQILDYFHELTNPLSNVDATVFYIKQEDIDSTLSRIIEERRSPNKEIYKDWIDLVVDYWGTQPYAKELGYEGVEGAYKYFKDRQRIELKALASDFPIASSVVTLRDKYDETFGEMLQVVQTKWLTK